MNLFEVDRSPAASDPFRELTASVDSDVRLLHGVPFTPTSHGYTTALRLEGTDAIVCAGRDLSITAIYLLPKSDAPGLKICDFKKADGEKIFQNLAQLSRVKLDTLSPILEGLNAASRRAGVTFKPLYNLDQLRTTSENLRTRLPSSRRTLAHDDFAECLIDPQDLKHARRAWIKDNSGLVSNSAWQRLAFEGDRTLELLGDKVMRLAVIISVLKNNCAFASKAQFSSFCQELVSDRTLSQLGKIAGITPLISTDPGHPRVLRKYVQADVLEALFGAVLLEKGYEETARGVSTFYSGLVTIKTFDQLKDWVTWFNAGSKRRPAATQENSHWLHPAVPITIRRRKSVLATGETVGYEFKNKALAYCAIHPGGKSPRIQLANTILTHLGRALFEYVATKKILQNKINGGLPAVRIVHSELEMSVDYERLAQQLEALKFDTPLPVRFDRGNYIPEKETAIRQRILRSAFFGVLGTICTESGVPKAESIAKKFL